MESDARLEEREKAKSLLKQEVLTNLETVSVKKEPDTETEAPEPLPQLPNLPDLAEMPAESAPSPSSESPTEGTSKKRIKIEKSDSDLKPPESDDWLADVICCGSEPGNSVSKELVALQEFERYVVEPPSSVNPLQCWKENEIFFPIIGKLARKYLAIPASSAASENFQLSRKFCQ